VRRLARATAVMSVGTVLSRATGLLRIFAIAAALGVVESGRLTDTYNLANTAPNIIYELILGGVLTSVFVPVFVDLVEKEGRQRAWEVASAIINVSLVVLTAIATIGIAAAPLIAKFYTLNVGGQEAVRQQEVMTFMLRLFIPQVIFYGLVALTGGLLNSHKKFGAPMYTPVLNNIAVIAVFWAFHEAYGAVSLDTISTRQLLVIGLGTTLGVVVNALAQIPFLRGLGRYKPSFSVRHPSVRELARLSVFVLGYVVVNQMGYLVVQVLAAGNTGGYTAYTWAFTFFLLPHGLFAVSVFTALLPSMSEHASNQRWDSYREQLSIGMRATFLLILPAAIGYLVLGEPIIRVMLEHGVMQRQSSELVAGVLRLFVLGLVPFSLFQLFLRAFYALHDTKTPFLINCSSVAVNTALNIPLYYSFGVKGLAIGHSTAYTFGVLLEGRALSKRISGIGLRRVLFSAARMTAAAGGMGLVVWALHSAISGALPPATLIRQVIDLVVPMTAGVAVYLALAYLLRVEELRFVRALAGRGNRAH
jgi:putative peptidoglycan lipid II flippase